TSPPLRAAFLVARSLEDRGGNCKPQLNGSDAQGRGMQPPGHLDRRVELNWVAAPGNLLQIQERYPEQDQCSPGRCEGKASSPWKVRRHSPGGARFALAAA